MAVTAGRHLDGVQLAHAVLGVMPAAGYIAMDALVFVGKRHFAHLPPHVDAHSMRRFQARYAPVDKGRKLCYT